MKETLLPHPALSAALVAVWLLLANEVSPGQLILGMVFALSIPLATKPFLRGGAVVRRPGLLALFLMRFLVDMVVANFQVARIILDPRRTPNPRFVELPLSIEDPVVATLLAGVISLTPGTVSARLSDDSQILILHCLDVTDEAALVGRIKARYEAPLREIFQCST